ncbi:uncharacterized protein EV422DRAFT_511218 [Fimicolochytrium jonesii]|uniref:uncharacterized protein n=1 Tax=Fimicolochytrium jonesii TaxID=1396493 RepID=UPI0022FDD7E7|nr:uncharacterized protein EV422DRAFT_511218 [Fimicolochytrium jonesii]KAI8826736.1 hypothetical protein EV422DRAFT_511218 [Fimicolochytrium jonesii]
MEKPAFYTSFWGENDKGLEVLMGRMKQGKHVCEELHLMLKERAAIEEDYGKRMAKLAAKFNPKEEIGTLREALDVVKNEIDKSAKAHIELAQEIRVKLEKPLSDFVLTQSAIRKNHNAIVEKHQKAKAAQVATVMKCKERYESKCTEAAQLSQMRPDPASKDAEKTKARLQKTQAQAKQADADYLAGVDKLTEIHRKWVDDFRTACTECQKLEEDRFHFLRGNVWNYANFLSGVCVADDEACERVRVSLEACDFEKDLMQFLDRSSTGSVIPQPLQYINFYTGASDSSRRNSEARGPDTASGSIDLAPAPYSGMYANTDLRRDSSSSKQSQSNGQLSPASHDPKSPASAEPALGDSTFQYDPYLVPESMPVLFSVRVLYDYQAQAAEELSIGKGQLIPVIATHDDGWWEGLGSENGKRRKGLFPSNFTETVR